MGKLRVFISGCESKERFENQKAVWQTITNVIVVNEFSNNVNNVSVRTLLNVDLLFLDSGWKSNLKAKIEQATASILGIDIFYNDLLDENLDKIKNAIKTVTGIDFIQYAHKKHRAKGKEFYAIVLFTRFAVKFTDRKSLSKLLGKDYTSITYYLNMRLKNNEFQTYVKQVSNILNIKEK